MDQTLAGRRARWWADDVVIAGAVVFAGVCVLFRAMHLSLAQSDVAGYVEQSHRVLANETHLPAYAALLGAARALTRGAVNDVALLQLVSLAAWCGSVALVARVLEPLGPPALARFGLALYGLFPFVGVTYVAWPIADALAHLALAAAVLALARRNAVAFPLALAAMLVVHKALWPFAALLALVALARRACSAPRIAAAAVPLALLWAWGARHGEYAWLVKRDLAVNIAPRTSLPVLDGLLGTLALGGDRGAIKGALLLALLAATVALAWVHARRRAFDMLALVVPILALLVLLNQWEIWAAMRYARILAVPAVAALAAVPGAARAARSTAAFWLFVIALGATQIAFALRIEHTFAAAPATREVTAR